MALGSFADILIQWDQLGLFQYILPFLLVFAAVFGILSYMGLFKENKPVQIIIALIFGIISIRTPVFADFLNDIAPRLGVGLTVLLTVLILVGLFVQDSSKKITGGILMALAAVIFIIIMYQSSQEFSFDSGIHGLTTTEIVGYILLIAGVVGVIIAVAQPASHGEGKLTKLFGGS